MKGKMFNEDLVMEYARRYNGAESRKERGGAVRWFMDQTGVSEGTARNVLRESLRGKSFGDIAARKQTRKPRKSEFERAREYRDAQIVMAIKQIPGQDRKKWIPTVHALRIAEETGKIPAEKYSRHKMDRLMREYCINHRATGKAKIAHRLTAKHPMRVIVADATPMDQYYLRLDGTVQRYDLPEGDKHQDDILAREHLSKIWVYYGVDMFSGSFLAMPFAGAPKGKNSRVLGENADDWMTFLKFFCITKHGLPSPLDDRTPPLRNCPIQGLPSIIYCDKGSGIGNSNRIKSTFGTLGVEIRTHYPGNPSAKGLVEGRISAFKRSFETQLIPQTIEHVNQLIYFYLAWADWWNDQRGYYAAYRKGLAGITLRQVTEENFRDANISHAIRTINAYGCVEIDGRQWFVTWDEQYRGEKVKVYRHPSCETDGVMYTVQLPDNTIVWPTEGIPSHDLEEFVSHPKSDGARNREAVKEMTQTILPTISFNDTLPPERAGNVISLPSPMEETITHSPVVPPHFMTEAAAWRWILTQTGLFMEELDGKNTETIQFVLKTTLENHGHIPGETAVTLANLINKNKLQEAHSEK